MYSYQNSVVKMIQESKSFFAVNPELTAGNPVLKAHVESTDTPIVELQKFKVIQETNISGIYINKKNAKKDLAKLIFLATGALRSFAIDIKDIALFEKIKLSLSKIARLADADIVSYSMLVTGLLSEFLNELKPYKISEEQIAAIKAMTIEYQILMLLPAKAIQDRAIATKKIKGQISLLLKIFDESIDNDMLQYYGTQLYDKYIARRQIYDSITHHLPFYGKLFDEETKLPIDTGAVTVIRMIDGKEVMVAINYSTKLGNYRFKELPAGIYRVKYEKFNYDTLIRDIEIIKGRSMRVDIGLRKTE